MTRSVLACTMTLAGAILAASSAQAQLLNERVVGEQRVCDYVGSDQLPDGQTIARTTIVPAGQPCPVTAPYRDPNRPIPGNAMLTGETAQGDRRECVYSQGGVEYRRGIPIAQRCAMTPDLLDRLIAQGPRAASGQ